MSEQLSDDAVRKVAKLSRLALNDEAIHRNAVELTAVLGYIERLRELDLEGTAPMAHPLDASNRFDEDTVRSALSNEALMRMAPASLPPFIRVPKVLGDGGGA